MICGEMTERKNDKEYDAQITLPYNNPEVIDNLLLTNVHFFDSAVVVSIVDCVGATMTT